MSALDVVLAGLPSGAAVRAWLVAARVWLTLLAAALVVLASLAAGWSVRGWKDSGEIESLKSRHASELRRAAEDAADALRAARRADGRAIATAQARADHAQRLNQELQDALDRVTTGRVCLSAGARGLLQRAPAFHAVPAAAAGAVAPVAAAATHSGQPAAPASSDRDVAGWISRVSVQYEQCRAQVDGVRDWAQQIGATNAADH